MLSLFAKRDRIGRAVEPAALTEALAEAIWIDMLQPTAEEIQAVEAALEIAMPTREEMREIEASSRVYEETEAVYLTASLPVNAETDAPELTEVSFILKGDRLVTLRYAEPQPFKTLAQRLERQGGFEHGESAFFWLVDAIVARLADLLERAAVDVDNLAAEVFRAADGERPDLVAAIARVGRAGQLSGRVRESLLTLNRILLFVGQAGSLPIAMRKDARTRAKSLNRDVVSLSAHADFVSNKVTFALDATLGLINIEQTKIIKIFSVLAMVFLPPTLIASIYGMNFEVMPELQWPLGYPFALVLMVISAVVPYLFFKRRGWL
jgi:magnesium transporter